MQRYFPSRTLGWVLFLSWLAGCGPFAAGRSAAADKTAGQLAAKSEKTGAAAAEKAPLKIDPLDWPNWRGPEQNGISRETGLIDTWNYEPEQNVLWKNPEAASISTPIVMRGKVYVLGRYKPGTKQEGEMVICLDAVTGKKIWENHFNVFLTDVPKERVGWSSCVGDPTTGRVYALGVSGVFQCMDGDSGKTIWSHSMAEEFGLLSTYGGRTNVPTLFDDLVVISGVVIGWADMAKPAHRFLAFNKNTGELVWFTSTKPLPEDTTYSTPTMSVIKGQAAMIVGAGDGAVWAIQPRTGKPIWNFQLSRRGLNVSPLVVGDRVYIGHNEENTDNISMGGIFAIDGTKSGDFTKDGPIWHVPGAAIGKSSPVLVDGRLYACDDGGKMYIVDVATGELVGRPVTLTGTIVRSSLLYADGKIFACTTAAWQVFKPIKTGVKLVQKLRMRPEDEISGTPIVSHGRIYLPTAAQLYCLGTKDQKPQATERPAAPEEDAASESDRPALAQVVPFEVLLTSGQKQQFTVRLFNARGQFLKTVPAKFSLDGPGQIDDDGLYQAAETKKHTATTLTAKVGDLSAKARIRVVSPLPWKFDFNSGTVPITWVGAQYRHIPIDFDLYRSLQKQQPRAAELYIYLTTGFVNGPTEKLVYNDRTPRRLWNELLRFFLIPGTSENLSDHVNTLSEAKREFNDALELLKKEKVIAEYDWSAQGEKENDIQLTVDRGPRRIEGNAAICKITTIPKGTRSQGWMGPPDLHDYTIQADVYGELRNKKLPDIGLIAQRYTLDLMGDHQQLQIRSWTPELVSRFSKTVPFDWKPETWYTVKFRASTEGGKAVLKGKVWPRDQKEPKAWSIEAVDHTPNLNGSPGLFGNATDAEIFLDNILVTPNGST